MRIARSRLSVTILEQIILHMFCLDVYWTDLSEKKSQKKTNVAVTGCFIFMSGFKKSKTAPLRLDSCLVIDADCHELVTDQLSVTLTSTLIVSAG